MVVVAGVVAVPCQIGVGAARNHLAVWGDMGKRVAKETAITEWHCWESNNRSLVDVVARPIACEHVSPLIPHVTDLR